MQPARITSYNVCYTKLLRAEPRRINPVILVPFLIISIIACGLILLTFGVVGMGTLTKIVGVNNTFTLDHIMDWRSNMAMVRNNFV